MAFCASWMVLMVEITLGKNHEMPKHEPIVQANRAARNSSGKKSNGIAGSGDGQEQQH
jgi:hypothetical protein